MDHSSIWLGASHDLAVKAKQEVKVLVLQGKAEDVSGTALYKNYQIPL